MERFHQTDPDSKVDKHSLNLVYRTSQTFFLHEQSLPGLPALQFVLLPSTFHHPPAPTMAAEAELQGNLFSASGK